MTVRGIAYMLVDDVVGDTVTIVVPFETDVSGSTWLMQLRTHPESPAVVATATIDDSDAVNGFIVATFAADDTEDLDPGDYYSGLERTDPSTTPDTVSTWPLLRIHLQQDPTHT